MKRKPSISWPKAPAAANQSKLQENLPRGGPATNDLSSGGIPLPPPPGRRIILGSAARHERIKAIRCGRNVNCLTEGLLCGS